jgi:hypothetical protein
LYIDTGGPNPQYQGQVAYQSIIGAEDRGSERTGQPYAAPSGKTAQHFAVDPLIGRHPVGGIHVAFVGRAALCALHQGEYEKAPEVRRQENQQTSPQAAAAWRTDIVAK